MPFYFTKCFNLAAILKKAYKGICFLSLLIVSKWYYVTASQIMLISYKKKIYSVAELQWSHHWRTSPWLHSCHLDCRLVSALGSHPSSDEFTWTWTAFTFLSFHLSQLHGHPLGFVVFTILNITEQQFWEVIYVFSYLQIGLEAILYVLLISSHQATCCFLSGMGDGDFGFLVEVEPYWRTFRVVLLTFYN